jgi:hypothetical protein
VRTEDRVAIDRAAANHDDPIAAARSASFRAIVTVRQARAIPIVLFRLPSALSVF